MADESREWLARETYKEQIAMFRTAWDLYIKFYTVFITINVTALGVTVQFIQPHNRWPLVAAFIAQNLVTFGTAIGMAAYGTICARHTAIAARAVARHGKGGVPLRKTERKLFASPVPISLGTWSGIANGVGHVALIFCWIATLFITPATQP